MTDQYLDAVGVVCRDCDVFVEGPNPSKSESGVRDDG